MSGWASNKKHPLKYELTATKASFYLRRDCSMVPDDQCPITYFLKKAGFKGVEETKYGWLVHATVGQIWQALSGQKSRDDGYVNQGEKDLKAAGLYVELNATDNH